jgi:hypothetical protein
MTTRRRRRVSVSASEREPALLRRDPCPTCGHPRDVVNGAILRFWRQRAGLDQRTFGKSLRVSGPYISDIETNRRECPDHVWQAYQRLRGR